MPCQFVIMKIGGLGVFPEDSTATFHHRAGDRTFPVVDRLQYARAFQHFFGEPKAGAVQGHIVLAALQQAELRTAEFGRAFNNQIEDGLQVGVGFVDDLQDVRGCSLSRKRLLRFDKLPRVLDGDHGVPREAFEQLNIRG